MPLQRHCIRKLQSSISLMRQHQYNLHNLQARNDVYAASKQPAMTRGSLVAKHIAGWELD